MSFLLPLLAQTPTKSEGMMSLSNLDVWIIIGFMISVIVIGSLAAWRSSKSSSDFFLSGRTMPWWLLGVSMVACTFSCDTPNLVTDLVRQQGVAGNWVWWAFLLTGMLTVFVYAKLWRRSALDTDLGFYEMRYSGPVASFLRGFRALYLGVFLNILIMATVSLAAIKIGQVMFGFSKEETLIYATIGVAVYATLGGLTGSIWADFYQYSVAMVGAIAAAYFVCTLPEVDGLSGLLSNENVIPKLDMLPVSSDGDWLKISIPLLIMPIAIQWWSAWYPGAEPGGGGYVAQRMLSAKDEKNAIGAVLLFNFMHYAVRPWPWIIVALASLVVFQMDTPSQMKMADAYLKNNKAIVTSVIAGQSLDSAQQANIEKLEKDARTILHTKKELKTTKDVFLALQDQAAGLTILVDKLGDKVDRSVLKHDTCYPAMIAKLPKGLVGIVVASLIAAYMSTIATHLNWGSSYFVFDFYRRYVRKSASEKELVAVGRICMLSLLVLCGLVSLYMENAKQAFDLLLLIGAGTGSIYILRWFWWRVNAYSEISAMISAFILGIFFMFVLPTLTFADGSCLKWLDYLRESHWQLIAGVGVTTVIWLVTTLITPCEDKKTLREFYRKVQPGGSGWQLIVDEAEKDGDNIVKDRGWDVPVGLICMGFGCLGIWSSLFSIGSFIYGAGGAGNYFNILGIVLGIVAIISIIIVMKLVQSLRIHGDDVSPAASQTETK